MSDRSKVTVLPQAMNSFSFNREILKGPHGTIMHKVVHEDLRRLDFVSTQPMVCYLIKGRERFVDPEGVETVLHAGDLIAIPRDVRLQSDFVSKDGPLEAILIFCADALMKSLARTSAAPIEKPQHGIEKIAAQPTLTAFMENLVAIYKDLRADADLVQAKLTELLLLLNTLHKRADLVHLLKPPNSQSRNLKEIMRRFGDQNLTSEELAVLSGRSIASFNRDFRRLFGSSPAQWRIERKLQRARQMLTETSLSVTGIALDLGYDSPSYFAEQFRKHFGKTPTQFRKERA